MTGTRTVRVPGPDHPITVTAWPGRVRVRAGGRLVADSCKAVVLKEADYPPVFYLPRADVAMGALARTSHTSWCPYKGEAAYFSIPATGARGENAVWSYEDPLPAMASICGRVAFYPDRVDAIETDDAPASDGRGDDGDGPA